MIFRDFLELFRKPGNPDRPIRAGESPIFPEPFGCVSRLAGVGKVVQNVVSGFDNILGIIWIRENGDDPG